jgi:adenosylcobinamide amidohydrolase
VTITEQATEVTAVVTAGVSNAKRAGERAEWRTIGAGPEQTGTINVIIITNALLSPAAMVEAIVTVTEAKAVALEESGVISPQTGRLATGTGTDALAIVGGFGPPAVHYCGKHVLFGEMLATATIQAITQALEQ